MKSYTTLVSICCEQFEQLYGYPNDKVFFAPGRINIIGEHIDYNGGLVFPCAISLGTVAAVGQRQDHNLRLYSHNFSKCEPQTYNMLDFGYQAQQNWCNYPLGVLSILQQQSWPKEFNGLSQGLDIVFFGNLPTGGSGLSSSASIEVLMCYILQSYHNVMLSREQLAVLAQQAENEFCGMNCGIMDQFIIAVAKAQQACLLDCATLEYQQIPLELGEHALLIANTKLPRKLQESKYNERRRECEAALQMLQQNSAFAQKQNLCSISESSPKGEFELALELLQGEKTLQKRVCHVVRENHRTHAAAAAMKAKDWVQLGNLLSASHASLRDDYQVSGPHLDSLVALLEQESLVLGARMTGAGFGGCAIALIKKSDSCVFEQLQQRIANVYCQQFGWKPEFYLSDAVDGVRELHEC